MELIKGGYYMKARCIQESAIALSAPYVREIWDWILKEANHKDTKVCKRGQCVRSFKDIQEGLKWFAGWRKHTYSKDQCEKAMAWLRKATMIATKKTTRGMVITVLNYDKYQTSENYEINNESIKKATAQQQPADTINKNDKNDKNILSAIADEKDIIQTLKNDNKRHIHIIGLYWEKKGFKPTPQTYQSSLKRDLRAGQALTGYQDQDIIDLMGWLEKNADYDWKLETVHKQIDSFIAEKSK